MEKVLKYERNYKWTLWTFYAMFGVYGLWCIFFDFNEELGTAAAGFACAGGLYASGNRVIKELKREIESLKSGDSTGADEPTPPADEPATDE